jgi:hypothetical protein
MCYQQPRSAVRKDVLGLGVSKHRIDGYVNQSGASGGQRQDASKLRLAHPARDAVAGLQAKLQQASGGLPNRQVQLREG